MASAVALGSVADIIKAENEGNHQIFCSLTGLAHFVAAQRTGDATGLAYASDGGILATIRTVSNERKAGAAGARSA
jgi:hypothetical protein